MTFTEILWQLLPGLWQTISLTGLSLLLSLPGGVAYVLLSQSRFSWLARLWLENVELVGAWLYKGAAAAQPGVDIVIGPATEAIAGEGKIVTAGGFDCHVHFIRCVFCLRGMEGMNDTRRCEGAGSNEADGNAEGKQ